MPNADGYHDTPVVYRTTGEQWVWHYCKGSDRDVLVRDTAKDRKAHLRECTARQKAEAKRQARMVKARRLESLKTARMVRGV